MTRRLLVLAFVVAGALLEASLAGSVAANGSPVAFDFAPWNEDLNTPITPQIDLGFDKTFGDPYKVVVHTPSGYTIDLATGHRRVFGTAFAYLCGTYSGCGQFVGSLELGDAPDASDAACLPAGAAAYLELAIPAAQGLIVPIAVTKKNDTYALVLCVDPARAKGYWLRDVGFTLSGLFHSPKTPGRYTFSAFVTARSPTGGPDMPRTYEVRAQEDLPEQLIFTWKPMPGGQLELSATLVATTPQFEPVTEVVFANAAVPRLISLRPLKEVVRVAHGASTVIVSANQPGRYFAAYLPRHIGPCRGAASGAPLGCMVETFNGVLSSFARIPAG